MGLGIAIVCNNVSGIMTQNSVEIRITTMFFFFIYIYIPDFSKRRLDRFV